MTLMQHTAGPTYGLFGDTPIDRLYLTSGLLDPPKTQREFIETLATLPLGSQPGEQFIYSVAVDMQGHLIEQWTAPERSRLLRLDFRVTFP